MSQNSFPQSEGLLIAPSILSADFYDMRAVLEMLNQSQAALIHYDVMDGHFVPNITFGLPVLKSLSKHSQKPMDVHLMTEKPERYIESFVEAGAWSISVHIETCPHLHRTLSQIKAAGAKAGIAVNPHTAISQLEAIVDQADFINLMSVNPGFGGQAFIEGTYRKISQVRELIEKSGSHCLIEIDGGVSLANAAKLKAAGAHILVAGNVVFSAQNPVATIAQLAQA